MQLQTFSYSPAGGWSLPEFPSLDSEETLVLVFGASSFARERAALEALRRAYPRAHFAGCSTSGEIAGAALCDQTLSVAVARFERTRLASAAAEVARPADSFAAGSALAQQLLAPDLRAILVLSDGLAVNGSELVRGLNAALPEDVVVTGGLAGDGDRFQSTWVLEADAPRSGAVHAVAFYGTHLRVGHGSQGGWDIFGPERLVTRSQGNVLYELDGKPALQLYKEYLGERARGLPATALLFPLAIRERREDTKLLVRTVLSIDEASQSMTFAGNIPRGHLAQLMRANLERLIDGAAQATLHALEHMNGTPSPTLAIAVSCVGRRLVLGERAEEEIEAVLSLLPHGSSTVGFYSYGEIAPWREGHCDLHNQTMTLTTLAED